MLKKSPFKFTIVGDATKDLKSQKEKQRILSVVENEHLTKVTEFCGYKNHSELMQISEKNHMLVQASKLAPDGG